jgi:hypothetical protein
MNCCYRAELFIFKTKTSSTVKLWLICAIEKASGLISSFCLIAFVC